MKLTLDLRDREEKQKAMTKASGISGTDRTAERNETESRGIKKIRGFINSKCLLKLQG